MKAYHIGLEEALIGRYVLLPGDPGRVPVIASFLKDSQKVASNREYLTYTGKLEEILVTVTSTGIGCPSAAICIEELSRLGAKVFIRVGTAGALQSWIKPGDIVISTAAIREEGTTRQYVPLSYPAIADREVTNALVEAAERLNIPFHIGITHCKDAFYSEIPGCVPLSEKNKTLWNVWQKSGVLATSMEGAALFIIGSLRNLYVGEVLAIVGNVYEHKEKELIQKEIIKLATFKAIKIALEAIKILAGKEGKLFYFTPGEKQ